MKPYLSENDLINELINNKKINPVTIPVGIFKERAYTSLVTPYKSLLCTNYDTTNKMHIYKENGDFSEYINFARIDDYISNRLSMYIEVFEKQFKTYVAEKISEKMVKTSIYCNDYSEFENIAMSLPDYKTISNSSLKQLKLLGIHKKFYDSIYFDEMYDRNMKIIPADKNIILNRRRALDELLKNNTRNGKTNNCLVQHHYNKAEIPPIWAVIHTLSFGDVLALFNMFQRNDRVAFVQMILNKSNVSSQDISKLSARINQIRIIRNNINHYEPLIPYLIEKLRMRKEYDIYSIINLLKNNYQNTQIQSVRIAKRISFEKIPKNDYTKKSIVYLNKILRNI